MVMTDRVKVTTGWKSICKHEEKGERERRKKTPFLTNPRQLLSYQQSEQISA